MLSIKRILSGGVLKSLRTAVLITLLLVPLILSFGGAPKAQAEDCSYFNGSFGASQAVFSYIYVREGSNGYETICSTRENVVLAIGFWESSTNDAGDPPKYIYPYTSKDGEVYRFENTQSFNDEPNWINVNVNSIQAGTEYYTANDGRKLRGDRDLLHTEFFTESFNDGREGTPPATEDPNVAEEPTEEAEDQTCESQSGATGWITCSLLRLTAGTLDILDRTVVGLLKVEEAYLRSEGTEAIWRNIRNLAYLILVPIVLFMVIATALGFDFVSAYTVKKTLPRLVIATIFIALSFELTKFAIIFINDISTGFLGLMSGAGSVNSLQELFDGNLGTDAGLLTLIAGGGAAAVVGAGGLMGAVWALVGFFAVAALAILFIVLLLAARQALIVMLAILAPLAVLSWIFPGNDKLWNLWKDSFGKLLMLFPIIMITLGAGRFFAGLVSGFEGEAFPESFINTILKLAAYILPYFLIPFLFKSAGGLFSNLTGMVNNRERGLLDRTRGWAKERKETSPSVVASRTARDLRKKERERIGRNRGLGRLTGEGGGHLRDAAYDKSSAYRKYATRGVSDYTIDAARAEKSKEELSNASFALEAGGINKPGAKFVLTDHKGKVIDGLRNSKGDTIRNGVVDKDTALEFAALGYRVQNSDGKVIADGESGSARAANQVLASQGIVGSIRFVRNNAEAGNVDKTGKISPNDAIEAWSEGVQGNVGSVMPKAPDLIKGGGQSFGSASANDMLTWHDSTARKAIEWLNANGGNAEWARFNSSLNTVLNDPKLYGAQSPATRAELRKSVEEFAANARQQGTRLSIDQARTVNDVLNRINADGTIRNTQTP